MLKQNAMIPRYAPAYLDASVKLVMKTTISVHTYSINLLITHFTSNSSAGNCTNELTGLGYGNGTSLDKSFFLFVCFSFFNFIHAQDIRGKITNVTSVEQGGKM